MDTALPQKFPFILGRNLAKANCTEKLVCTSCDTVVLGITVIGGQIVMFPLVGRFGLVTTMLRSTRNAGAGSLASISTLSSGKRRTALAGTRTIATVLCTYRKGTTRV